MVKKNQFIKFRIVKCFIFKIKISFLNFLSYALKTFLIIFQTHLPLLVLFKGKDTSTHF